jgi:autophagy-related protein 2
VDNYLQPSHLEPSSFAPPAQLAPTIYPSEEGVTERGASGRKGQGQGSPMLSAAVRIHLDPHKNVKVQLSYLSLSYLVRYLLLGAYWAWAPHCPE